MGELRWGTYEKRIKRNLKRHGIKNFRANHAICKGFGDSAPSKPIFKYAWQEKLADNLLLKKILLKWFYEQNNAIWQRTIRLLRERAQKEYQWVDIDVLPETTKHGCQTTVMLKGKEISLYYLECYKRIEIFSHYIDFKEVESVLEIGGGFGANIHLLSHLYPTIQNFYIVDLPTIQSIACYYLDSFNIPYSIGVPKHVDLLWNSYSFEEMDVKIVESYMAQINTDKICLSIADKSNKAEEIVNRKMPLRQVEEGYFVGRYGG